MSLRSVGDQLLQTAPSTLLAGASTASLSLWVVVNPGCNVANPAGVEIFGDAGDKLSATLSGSGSLLLRWLSHDGGTNGSSSCGLTLAPGTSYHLATTWRGGAQQYYLNGVPVRADAQGGLIGIAGDVSAYPFRLGSDSAGADVTVDEPTLWVGYALSAQDVLNLRDRAVLPGAIAPSSIALRFSLAGPDGIAARVGDAGLADGSATGLDLSSVVGAAPSYLAGALSYIPPARIGMASVAPSGEGLSLLFEDAAGNPTNITSLRSSGDRQTLTLAGLPVGGSFALSFNGQTTAPIAVVTDLPTNHGLWSLAGLTAGQAYQLAFPVHFLAEPIVLHRVYDGPVGSTLLFSGDVNEQTSDFDFTYGFGQDGTTPVNWTNICSVTPTGTELSVLITSDHNVSYIALDALYVKKVGDGTIAIYDDLGPQCGHGPGRGEGADPTRVGGSWFAFDGTGNTSLYTASPPAVQAALLALSSVQAGGLTVTSPDNGTTLVVDFVGPMKDAAQPAITTTDPAVAVAHTITGGDVPSMIVNGGAPFKFYDAVWGITGAPTLPYVYLPFPQAAKSPQFSKVDSLLNSVSGPGWVSSPVGYGSNSFFSGGAGDFASFPFQGLPPGTYQFSATWPTGIALPNPYAGMSLSATANFMIEDSSGAALATVVVDQSIAPTDPAQDGVGWKILGSFPIAGPINGLTVRLVTAGSAHPVAANGVRLVRTSADNSSRIAPGDTVTVSIPSGWANTVAGAIAPAVNVPVANRAGMFNFLPVDATAPKTMKVGYNNESDDIAELIYRYTNLARRLEGPYGLTWDANGYPLTGPGPTLANINIAQFSLLNTGQNGRYTFLWDGAKDDITPSSLYGHTVNEVAGLRNLTGGANNRRVYDIRATGQAVSPAFGINITSNTPDPSDGTHTDYLHDFQNLRVFPPDPSDATGDTAWGTDPATPPPKWHPSYIAKFQGIQSIRLMDDFSTNNSNIVNITDLIPQSFLGYVRYTRNVSLPVTDFRQYTGPDTAFDLSSYTIARITTGIAHNLVDGQILGYTGPATIALSDGGTVPAIYAQSNIRVLSPTTFLIKVQNGGARTMTNVIAAGTVDYGVGNTVPLADMVDLINAIPGLTEAWINVPFCASDAYVTAVANEFGANVRAGVKFHVEFTNEPWNSGFYNWFCLGLLTKTLGLGGYNEYAPGYVHRFKQVHDLFEAALTPLGRGGDLVRTVGSQASNPGGSTTPLMAAAIAQGSPRIDEVATATYFNSGPEEPSLRYLNDVSTVDQDLDRLELFLVYGGSLETWVRQHKLILNANAYTATGMVNYEGGPSIFYSQPTAANQETRNHALLAHPRMYYWGLAFLQTLQDKGCTLFNDFLIAGSRNTWLWSTWWGWNQQPGKGDPIAESSNITDPENPFVKSEFGGAMKAWGSLIPASSTNPKRPRSIPGRNGQLRAVGYPRGMSRPTR